MVKYGAHPKISPAFGVRVITAENFFQSKHRPKQA